MVSRSNLQGTAGASCPACYNFKMLQCNKIYTNRYCQPSALDICHEMICLIMHNSLVQEDLLKMIAGSF